VYRPIGAGHMAWPVNTTAGANTESRFLTPLSGRGSNTARTATKAIQTSFPGVAGKALMS